MKKTILSLTAVLAMFAGVTVHAQSVSNSDSEVTGNEFVATEPTVNIIYRSELDVPRNSKAFYDARGVKGKDGGILDFTLKPDKREVREYIQLSQGQKLRAGVTWFNVTSSDGSITYQIRPTSTDSVKEITADKDGYYLIEYATPKSDVQEYTLVTGTTVYEKS